VADFVAISISLRLRWQGDFRRLSAGRRHAPEPDRSKFV
jgi:hypothetical protein